MSREELSRAIGLRTLPVAAVLIVLLVAGWPAAQQGGDEGSSREGSGVAPARAHESTPPQAGTQLRRPREGRPPEATVEVRVDELLQESSSGGRRVLNRRALTRLVRDIVGNDIPVREVRLRDLFDKAPRMRVSFRGRSLVLNRLTLTRLAQRVVGKDVSLEHVRLGDLLDADMQAIPDNLLQELDERSLVTGLREMLGKIQRVDPSRDPRFEERQALQLQYLEVTRLVRRVRLDGYNKPSEVYDEAHQRLLAANQVDAVPLLDGHLRLEEELASADLRPMSYTERIAYRWQARRWAFGNEMAELLFNREEAMERYEIDQLAIEADDYATEEDKGQRIRDRRQALKVELAAQGTYVSFPDETPADVEQELQRRHRGRLDLMTADEREEAVRQIYLEKLPPALREAVERLRQNQAAQAGIEPSGSGERRQP